MFEKEQMIKRANDYKQENHLTGGVVIFWGNELTGWAHKDKLNNPEEWRPGCIAIDEHGECWESQGGDYQNGSKKWMPIN